MSQHFDVVVLGAGPGGYVAAIRAAQLGKSVAVVEAKYWGGVCLNVGCIPSKALLRNAELAHILSHEKDKFGITGDASMDFVPTHARSRKVSEGIVKGVHFLMKKNKITEINGWGTLTGDKSAYVMKNFGVDVTIVEFLDRMVPTEDEEVSKELLKHYKKLGVTVMLSTKVESIDDSGDKVKVTVSPARGGDPSTGSGQRSRVIETDKVLQAIGFAPRVEGFGLENAGVKLTDRGAIDIDEVGRTNVDGIYAIGDCTGKLMLAHTAEAMGIVAAETLAGAETLPVEYDFIPRATYCQPQVASFGYSEEQAKERGYDVKTAKFPFSANGKAMGLGDPVGFVKIVADAKYNEILGAHMIGPDVTELLPALTLAQRWDLTADEVARNVFAHPTLSEAVKEAVEGIAGHMINL